MPLGLKGPIDMRTVAALVVALSALGISTSAAAPTADRRGNAGATSFTAISPIFSQLVAFSLPANFKTVFENTSDRSYIREAVLKGETTDRWTQMITVTGAKGLAGNPKTTPESVAAGIAGEFKKRAPTRLPRAYSVRPNTGITTPSWPWQVAAKSSRVPTSIAKRP